MKISAVKLYDKGYMLQPFAFGGETARRPLTLLCAIGRACRTM